MASTALTTTTTTTTTTQSRPGTRERASRPTTNQGSRPTTREQQRDRPTSDAYLKLSRYLPPQVCLKYARDQWAVARAEAAEKDDAEVVFAKARATDVTCEHAHAALLGASDLWCEEVEKSTHVFAIPNARRGRAEDVSWPCV